MDNSSSLMPSLYSPQCEVCKWKVRTSDDTGCRCQSRSCWCMKAVQIRSCTLPITGWTEVDMTLFWRRVRPPIDNVGRRLKAGGVDETTVKYANTKELHQHKISTIRVIKRLFAQLNSVMMHVCLISLGVLLFFTMIVTHCVDHIYTSLKTK